MASSISLVSLLSAAISVFAIFIVFSIIRKVYQEEYRRPWLFIGISALFFAMSELLRFVTVFFGLYIVNIDVSEFIIYILVFISISFLAYGLLLEYLVLNFIKGKFVKMKFIPVQEGTMGGELDINVSRGNSYLAFKKDRKFLFEQFSEATKKGFEGFLITEENPSEIRNKYNVMKSPIAWITQIDESLGKDYVKKSLDENSDIVDPIQVNSLISYVDNFLEQSVSPFIVIELNTIFKTNSNIVVFELLKYLNSRMKKFDGIMICLVNTDVLGKSEVNDLKEFLLDLE